MAQRDGGNSSQRRNRDADVSPAARPDEVPIVSTGSGLGGGEFEFIASFMPEIAEPRGPVQPPLTLDAAAIERGERIRAMRRTALMSAAGGNAVSKRHDRCFGSCWAENA